MKEQLIRDVILGFILLSIFLNFINGYISALIESFSEQFKLSLYSLIIICVPSLVALVDFTFNSSEKSSKTIWGSIFSAVITLVVREIFVYFKERKERNDIREEIFSELYGNYRSLKKVVQLYQSIGGNVGPEWNKSITWIDKSFYYHLEKLSSKKIYSQELIYDLRDIYKFMESAIRKINNDDPTFKDPKYFMDIVLGKEDDHYKLSKLSEIKDLLIRLDGKKAEAYKLFEVDNI